MFLHATDDPARTLAIPQTSHAWLAWQLAEHWGNRRFCRPRPRAEVLAAVMLHDSGWTEFDAAAGVDDDGRPRTFDRMGAVAHLEIWRRSIDRAAQHSRYAALLVARHFADMAAIKRTDLAERGDDDAADLTAAFVDEMERREVAWCASLATDARYQGRLDGPGRSANADILTLADKVSVYLCGSLASEFEVAAPVPDGGTRPVVLRAVDRGRWRVDPWPMEGDRVRLQCEGRRLGSSRFAGADEFHEAYRKAPIERLGFTLVRASAVG